MGAPGGGGERGAVERRAADARSSLCGGHALQLQKEFVHLLQRGRSLDFVEVFNNKILIKQEGCDMNVIDVSVDAALAGLWLRLLRHTRTTAGVGHVTASHTAALHCVRSTAGEDQ